MKIIIFLSIICFLLFPGCVTRQNQSENNNIISSKDIEEITLKLETEMNEDEASKYLNEYGIKITEVKDEFTGNYGKGFIILSSPYSSYTFILKSDNGKLKIAKAIAHSVFTISLPSGWANKKESNP